MELLNLREDMNITLHSEEKFKHINAKCLAGQQHSPYPEEDMEMKTYHPKFMIKEIPLQKGKHHSDEVYIK